MIKTLKLIRSVRELEAEKQRRIKVEREARALRIAALALHQKTQPPAARKVWHP